jgi:hypothetical protein
LGVLCNGYSLHDVQRVQVAEELFKFKVLSLSSHEDFGSLSLDWPFSRCVGG